MSTPAIDATARIRTSFERNARAIALRPSVAQGTAVTKVRLTDGLTCEIEEGAWKLTADLSEKSGGDNRGPNPGILGRAALGSCLAMGYRLWAAHRNIPIDSLEIEIQADYDSRAMHGIEGAIPGYREIRYVVRIASPAPEADVRRLLDDADAHSDFLYVFSQPQRVIRETHVNGG